MNDLIQWGLAVVLWVQTFRNPLFDQFFLTINFLGDEEFYLMFLPVVFWCLHKTLGMRMGVLFLLSFYANQWLKDLFTAPRPHQVSDKLYAPVKYSGYGIPSGHAQGTATVWGYLATQLRKPLWWILALGIPLLISVGRMYMGDHFPQDVIAGLVIGVALVTAYAVLEPRVAPWVVAQSLAIKIALVVIVSLALAFLHLTVDTAVLIGTFLGFYGSVALEEDRLRFDAHAIWWKQLVKLAIGLAVVFGLRLGLKAIFPVNEWFNLLRYAIIGVWIGLGAPWVFVMARLAGHGKREPTAPAQIELTPAG
ncbi:MAG: phosphatase PAP2 family protein [Chloroflexi bacterium]|nr:phosphatase PAP2 family protein [Chloroflexota bacterium]